MEGDGQSRRWNTNFKERLGCCGAAWGQTGRAISVQDDEEDDDITQGPNVTPLQSPHQVRSSRKIQSFSLNVLANPNLFTCVRNSGLGCVKLATALAAERQLRAMQSSRVSLLRLLEEAKGGVGKSADVSEEEVKELGGSGTGCCCCVCLVRNKGAPFIPSGHTFCRVCSREVWLNRGSCPLCNRHILEILDII